MVAWWPALMRVARLYGGLLDCCGKTHCTVITVSLSPRDQNPLPPRLLLRPPANPYGVRAIRLQAR